MLLLMGSWPDCLARVRAKSVLPVPGGPCRRRCLRQVGGLTDGGNLARSGRSLYGVPFFFAFTRELVVHCSRSVSSSCTAKMSP